MFYSLGSSLTNSQLTFTWDAQPISKTVEEGSTATFRCSATSNRKIEYIWYHNNQTIDSEPRFTVTDGTLEITNTKFDDRGSYQCYVKRASRDKILGKSDTATLNVKGKLT